MNVQNKRLTAIVLTVAALLLIPFVAMRFTDEVNWTLSDFIIAGFLLLGTGILCEIVLRSYSSTRKRLIICGGILFALLVVWAELAVGVFGSPFAGS